MIFSSPRSIASSLLLSSVVVLGACGSDDGDGGGGESGGGTDSGGSSSMAGTGPSGGDTMQPACGISRCEIGQHCNNGLCINGCLSDANCGAEQACQDIDTETKLGTCENLPMAPVKDCDALCDKALACMDPTVVMCMEICTAASAVCVACLIDSNCGAGCEDECDG
jgi:hypothetical protein